MRLEKSSEHKSLQARPLSIRVGKKLRNSVNRLSSRQSTIPTDPVLSPAIFGWTGELAAHWQDIADEARQILLHRSEIPPLNEISPDHARIAGDGKWRSFFLVGYGYEVAENCARAPKTAALVKSIPGLNSAFFSILDPGAHIPRHRGVTRGIVTCHLGLIVPDDYGNCVMEVEDQQVHWREGEWLVFDDSYHHQVWNNTDQQRVILLLQVKRPMRFMGRLVNDLALGAIRHSPFVQDARKELGKWESAYQLAEQDEAA